MYLSWCFAALIHHFLRFPASVSSPKKESRYFVLSQHPPQLLEAEEGDKSHKNDQTPGEKFMGPFPKEINETSREPFPLPKALDYMLDEGKDSRQRE